MPLTKKEKTFKAGKQKTFKAQHVVRKYKQQRSDGKGMKEGEGMHRVVELKNKRKKKEMMKEEKER